LIKSLKVSWTYQQLRKGIRKRAALFVKERWPVRWDFLDKTLELYAPFESATEDTALQERDAACLRVMHQGAFRPSEGCGLMAGQGMVLDRSGKRVGKVSPERILSKKARCVEWKVKGKMDIMPKRIRAELK